MNRDIIVSAGRKAGYNSLPCLRPDRNCPHVPPRRFLQLSCPTIAYIRRKRQSLPRPTFLGQREEAVMQGNGRQIVIFVVGVFAASVTRADNQTANVDPIEIGGA